MYYSARKESDIMADRIISARLRQARKDAGLTQYDVYNHLGISQSTFSAWETGKSEPSISVFLQLCSIYKINDISAYFTGGDTSFENTPSGSHLMAMISGLSPQGRAAVYNCIDFEYNNMRRQQTSSLRTLPLYLQPAAAGIGNYLGDSEYEEIEIEAPLEADACVRISGDSMKPVVCDGDIVFVKFQPQILKGQTGIFVLNGEAYCKKLEYRSDSPCLSSFNPAYPPIFINPSDELRVIGKVLL